MTSLDSLIALADSSQDLVRLYDEAGVCGYTSGRCWDLLGYTPEELLAGGMSALLHPDEYVAELKRLRARALAGTPVESRCYRALARDGETVTLKTRYLPLDGLAHGPYRVMSLTTRCQTPEDSAIEKEELKWHEYFYAMDQHALVSISDRRGDILYVNEKFCAAVGRPRNELIGENHRIFKTGIHDDDFYRTLWGTIAKGRVWQGEITVRTCSDAVLWTWMTVVPVGGKPGRPKRYIGLRTDVTDQHRIQDELEQAREEAVRASDHKSQFLANVSHELRTPLNAIIGMSGLLAETELDDMQRNYLGVFETAGRNLLDLVNNLLDMSKLDAGRMLVEPHAFDLHEMLQEAFALFLQRAQEKGVEMGLDIRPGVPRRVVSDSIHLRQICNNLLNNAVKFTSEGWIRVTVEARPDERGGRVLHVAVVDTGTGIPEAKQAEVFKPFVQADAGITRQYGGTGLGLALTRQFAQLLGGTLWVESTEGEGSAFHVEIPVSEPDEDASPAFPEAGAVEPARTGGVQSAGGPGSTPEFAGRHALVAEDEPTNVLLLRTLLEQWGMVVTAVANGEEAVAAWRDGHYDVILMDLQMPVMDGEQAAAEMFRMATEAGATVPPILALSAHMLEEPRNRCLETGFADYLTKPVDRRALYQALQSAPGMARE